jgi:tetratricopeptide (TPR) repeat protein
MVPGTESTPSSSSPRWPLGTAILAIALYIALIDAVVETFLSGSPVRWWVAGIVAGYFAVGVGVWLYRRSAWQSMGWSARASASFFLLLGLLAFTAWLPDGLIDGIQMVGQSTSTVLSLFTTVLILLVGISLVRLPWLPRWSKIVAGVLAAYGLTAFVVGIVTDTEFVALLHGDSLWTRLPAWLQGAFLGAFVVVPAGLLLHVAHILKAAPGVSRAGDFRQVIAMAMSVLMAVAGVARPAGAPADYYNKGVESANAGQWTKAMHAFKQATKADPNDGDAHYQLAYAHQQLKHFAEAVVEYKEAVRLKPDDGDAQFNLGWCQDGLNNFADAIAPLKEAARLKPQDALARAELAYAYLQLKRYPESEAAYAEVLKLRPDDAKANYLMGWSENIMGKFPQAIEALNQAIKLQPDMTAAYSELGYANRSLQKYPEALVAYSKAVSLDAKFAPAHHGLGITYLALGNKAAAQEQYRTLQTLDAEWAKKLNLAISK